MIALLIWLGTLSSRIDELQTRTRVEADATADRIRRLERQIAQSHVVAPELPAPQPIPIEIPQEVPPPIEPLPPTPPPLPLAEPTKPDTDWEAIIGGNWANKAGVVVLIIGLALFLQYSLTHLGPAGRVAVGWLLSGTMLTTGVLLEKRDPWRIYARGLIGGGWAGLYFTTYAAHAIDAARVIESPTLATTVLLAISVGMITHSLFYRSETVTGLTYFITFGTLAISPLSAFAVIAALPLSASLLWIACRFDWTTTVIAGQAFTFLLYLIHIGAVGFRPERLIWGELSLIAYWILFEIYDVAFAGRAEGTLRSAMIVLNAAGFLALSLAQWQKNRPATIWMPLFITAALYAASCILRARLNPPSSFEGTGLATRSTEGSYEGAAFIASALTVAGIFNAFHGLWINAALLAEAEFLLWLSVRYRQSLLQHLSSIIFVFPFAKLTVYDIPADPMNQTPIAFVTAATALANRLWRPNLIAYSFAAGVITATVLSFELPAQWVPFAWLGLAAVIFEASNNDSRRDWMGLALSLAVVASFGLCVYNVLDLDPQVAHPSIPQSACALLTAIAAFQAHRQPKPGAVFARNLGAGLSAASLAALAYSLIPNGAVVLLWAAIAFALLEIGLRVKSLAIRVEAHILLVITCAWLFTFDAFDNRLQIWHLSRGFLVCAPVIALLYFTRARYGLEVWERRLTRVYSFFGALVAVLVVFTDFDRAVAILAFGFMGFLLLLLARRNAESDFFTQAHIISVLAFGRALRECASPHQLFGFDTALLAGIPLAALFYAAEFVLPRSTPDARNPRTYYSAAASLLVAAILFAEVRGGLLTVAWALEAVSLLIAGFSLRERVLRLSGLLLLCVCVLKVFFYDLSTLSRPYQILSFVALGILLLAASAFYTRFKERFREYFL